ncbi:DUF262 domain-containing HNH endonuclease family protein [Tenacibaculum dicentrarchi]|nr:DUF262 domain-containing HNH endonuclease family protein [Tenacibaculum dicentrarchi]MCD8421201.1 DUF262 domain-containing HNH endonuclease family protein [Tenacibaculum dicentrarchi]
MEKQTLSKLLNDKIFNIPDYQRGFAWETKQLNDFTQDIDALIDEKIISHYTGTIVIFQKKDKPTENYGIDRLEVVDVVDGQQRLTTCSIYLSIILKELIKLGEDDFKLKVPIFLKNGSKSKLRLNNDTADFYFDLINTGTTNTKASTVHQKRLLDAYNYLQNHITQQEGNANDYSDYLKKLFDAIIRKLNFSFYTIEFESEIGMTFELMNSRGKDLSALELLKNYLMYWVYRNIPEQNEKEDLTSTINKSWKNIYTNIADCNGNEYQCLRIGWTLQQSHTPKHWKGYNGFKNNSVIPLRDFSIKNHEDTKKYIFDFTNGLAEISKQYSEIVNPSNNEDNKEEYFWLSKIKNAGNISNLLPLMVATRLKYKKGIISYKQYINLLVSLEKFIFRIYLWEGKRSNTGLSTFYKWASEIHSNKQSIEDVINWIYGTINWYSNENKFRTEVVTVSNWYSWRRLLKYTLFEYELWLLKDEGKDNTPKLIWSDLSDSTIEHILPQNPKEDSIWKKDWNESDFNIYLHDISNLVLTKDNSHYSNFEFIRKKGKVGTGHSYSNSDIREERKISEFTEWTVESCKIRRKTLEEWIIKRWGIEKHYIIPENLNEEDDIDSKE